MLNFMKIRLMGAELFHAGRRINRQTDITKLMVAFRNFANQHENMILKNILFDVVK